jgi:serine/threonine protein phosphatase PrpC
MQIFEGELDKEKGSIKGVITRTLAKTDEQLKLVGASDTGSTCCLAFVRKEGVRRACYVANLGDTRAVLSVDGNARRVSVDHKPTAQSEIERIKYTLCDAGRRAGSS